MKTLNADFEEINENDTAVSCLAVIAALHNIVIDKDKLIHTYGKNEFSPQTLLIAAKEIGLSGKMIKQPLERLSTAPLPAIGIDLEGKFFIAGKYINDADIKKILIQYPGKPPEIINIDIFVQNWSGNFFFFKSKASYSGDMAKFDFTWFIPLVIKYRRIWGEILIVSLIIQLIGLATPLFFQVVMDKVLVNQAWQTLNVIAIGLMFALIFETLLTFIRSWVFAHTSSKVDVELGAKLFRHLLGLPIAYFQARRVGDSVARIRELEHIRSFLTGNAMTVLLDLFFSFVFIFVMIWYSWELSRIVLISIPIYFTISLIFTPILRKRLDIQFNKGAENQSFLVETVSGVDTIKSAAAEPQWIRKWDLQLASYVTSGLSVANISNASNALVIIVSKIVNVAIIYFGATLVINNKLTVGELIAFNMLANQVSTPILRLAQLWNDFQQVGISMARLGDILNTRTELSSSKTYLPEINGSISLENISFRYRPDLPEALRNITLHIEAGKSIGIVGRSGSGKSTLTKLIQRLYVPERGRILIDGHDISTIDSDSLRKQVGVVLQENTLFSRSIRDNIAISYPTASMSSIIDAANLAGAHEFICELPQGYDTLVGEHGSGLSGGQRQRIAIARALLTKPRILIFDEATSALDYESESIIQENMNEISMSRTVIIIAHRLSAVRNSDYIVVMNNGSICEIGNHDNLLSNKDGIYSRLYSLQQRNSK